MKLSHNYIFVYQTINEINGKCYVGVHATNKLEDGYIGCGISKQSDAHREKLIFHKAVRKYGYTAFRRYILSFYDTYEEALAEEKYIVNHKWVKKSNNYNAAIGGRGSGVFWMSDEEKKAMYLKISIANKGKKRSKEFCDNLSKIKKGKKLSSSHKESLKKSNARHWLGKKRGEEFKSNLSKAKMGVPLSESHKKSLSISAKKRPPNNLKAVIQYSSCGNFIKEYESAREAGRRLGLSHTSIQNNLAGRANTSGGFLFKYKGGDN